MSPASARSSSLACLKARHRGRRSSRRPAPHCVGERKPHQAARGLARHAGSPLNSMRPSSACACVWPLLAAESSQRAAWRGSLLGRRAVEQQARQIILRVGVAEIGRRVGVHLARAADDRASRRCRGCRRDSSGRAPRRRWRRSAPAAPAGLSSACASAMRLKYSNARRSDCSTPSPSAYMRAELPLRRDEALLGGVFERAQRLFLLPVAQRARAGAEGFERRDRHRQRPTANAVALGGSSGGSARTEPRRSPAPECARTRQRRDRQCDRRSAARVRDRARRTRRIDGARARSSPARRGGSTRRA